MSNEAYKEYKEENNGKENKAKADEIAGQPGAAPEETAAAPGDTDQVEGKTDEFASLQSQLAEQKARAEDYYHRLARVQADYENYRRRTRQEKEEFYRYASEQLIVKMLPVLDNFDRALAAESQSIEDFKAGIEMIYRQLQDVLTAEGLAPVPALGEQFDPEKHEAVLREETDAHPDNTIIEEMQRGYYLKEKVIRAAMVKIAKSS